MAIFTHLSKNDILENTSDLGEPLSLTPIDGGTDNSVYLLKNTDGSKYIYKLYEGKNEDFIKKLLAIHKRIEDILSHQPLKVIQDKVTEKISIIFTYLENTRNYNISEILEYISIFHESLNRYRNTETINKSEYFKSIEYDMEYFIQRINTEGYISNYPDINLNQLLDIYKSSLLKLKNDNQPLSVGLIHNDLNAGNIINSHDNGIEFIDFDGVNKNLLLKDYIIFIIRFNLYHEIDQYFEQDGNNDYKIGTDIVSKELLTNLYQLYSIYLIFNMIYYIGYDNKNVVNEMYGGDNQSWNEIYNNLQKNKIIP